MLLANQIITHVAVAQNAVLVDIHGLFDGKVNMDADSLIINPANSSMDDGVHPTAQGYQVIADAVYSAIVNNGLSKGKIICFGDSITYGTYMAGAGTATGETYPGQLQNK